MCTIQHGLSYNQEIYFLCGKPESSSKTFRLRYVIFCQKQINFFCILADFLLSSCFCIKSNLQSCIAFNPSPCFAGNSRPLDPATRLAAVEIQPCLQSLQITTFAIYFISHKRCLFATPFLSFTKFVTLLFFKRNRHYDTG